MGAGFLYISNGIIDLMRQFLTALLLLSLVLTSQAQFIDNGSLEGEPGTRTPVNWFSCLAGSTVDIGPGVWDVTLPAHDGDTYINMVCRGPEQSNRGTCEELSQTLKNTLEAGKCYRFEVYLAYFPEFGVTPFRNPLDLIINAGTDACSRDLEIGRYESIDHEDWRRYVTYINPDQDLNGMLLEVDWSGPDIYSGHMLVDDMRIEEITAPPVTELLLCEGETALLTAFNSNDASSVVWSNGSEEDFIEVNAAGSYTVEVTLGNCVFTQAFEVTLQPAPALTLTSEEGLCPDDELLLDATTTNATYLWDDGSTAATRTIVGPGEYRVSVTVGLCTNEYTVNLQPDNCLPLLEMPNAFSPNQDGKNDLLTPIQTQYIASMKTVIYNRWGNEVYSTTNLNIVWDGNLPNGEPAPPSTYYYRVVYTGLLGDEYATKGTVTILK